MTDTTEQLIRERDEARAAVEALRATLNHTESRLRTISRYHSGDALTNKDCLDTAEAIREALNHPNPAATLLEHLRAAEVVCRAASAMKKAWEALEANHNSPEATCNEWREAEKALGHEQAAFDAALAAWRKLTENRNET